MSKYQLPIVASDQMPLVELDVMNRVHREEVEIINQLGTLLINGLQSKPDIESISHTVMAWIDHTREHFEGENSMMMEHGFPPYPVHKGEHDQVLLRLEALQAQWLRDFNLETLADYLFIEWRNWFDNHVRSMDMVTAQFLGRFIR
ncbi:MAG: hemerythrin family protein [Chromatiales bacterium]|nr:hemerythrin family protein [Chromatiales bacterium]